MLSLRRFSTIKDLKAIMRNRYLVTEVDDNGIKHFHLGRFLTEGLG